MVSSISQADKSLDPTYANFVNVQIDALRTKYVTPYESEKDTLELQKSVFTDLENYFSELRSAAQALISTDGNYLLDDTYTAAVSDQTEGKTVLTAETENDAVPAEYSVTVSNLADEHRVASDKQISSSTSLGYLGSMTINDVSISIEGSDTLISIASKINSAEFDEDEGQGVTASVIDNRLVLSADETGAEHEMIITDTGDVLDGLGITESASFKNEISEARDATFVIDGLTVTRASNTDLDDIIQGVTLNFASDAEGETIKLSVETDYDTMKKGVEDYASKFNTLVSYIEAKMTVTKIDDDTVERGALAGNTTVMNMRSNLISQTDQALSGYDYTYLTDIGIEFDDDMKMVIADQDALNTALMENLDGVTEFLDAKMGAMEDSLDVYIGSAGVVTYTKENFDTRIERLETRIEDEEERLLSKEEILIQQYASIQDTMNLLQNDLTTIGALNSSFYSNLNTYT